MNNNISTESKLQLQIQPQIPLPATASATLSKLLQLNVEEMKQVVSQLNNEEKEQLKLEIEQYEQLNSSIKYMKKLEELVTQRNEIGYTFESGATREEIRKILG